MHSWSQIKSQEHSMATHPNGINSAEEEKKQCSTVYSMSFSKLCRRMVTGHRDGSVRIWSVFSGTDIINLSTAHNDMVFGVAVHPHEDLAASSSFDGTVKLWSLTTGECRQVLEKPILLHHGRSKQMTRIVFSTCGRYLFVGCNDK